MNLAEQHLDSLHNGPVSFNSVCSNEHRRAHAKAYMAAIRKLIKACSIEGAPYLDKRIGLFYSANLITQRQLNKLDDELRQHLEKLKCLTN